MDFANALIQSLDHEFHDIPKGSSDNRENGKTASRIKTPKTSITPSDRYAATQRVTLTGAVVNVLLAAAQLIGGTLTHSHALIADGVHTVSDLASDFMVLVASRHANREADAEHPYGHGRIETLATSILGLMLIVVAGGIFIDAVHRILNPEKVLHPTPIALIFAFLAVISKEALYQYTHRVAKRVRSPMLEANAWHHRSDAISSLFVIAGIVGSLMGFPDLDCFAAVIVAQFIFYLGGELLWHSTQELIDSSLDEGIVEKTKKAIAAVDGVEDIHLLRTRKSGGDGFADVHIEVPSTVSISEGHQISETVRKAVVDQVEEITDVTIHIDPEDDSLAKPCDHLPLREEIIASIKQAWVEFDQTELNLAQSIETFNLHYLDGQIHVDAFLKKGYAHEQTLETLKKSILSLSNITQVKLYFNT